MENRTVRATLDNHFRTSGYLSERIARIAVNRTRERLGQGGIVALLRYDGKTERDPRWDTFERNVPYDKVPTGNGFYFPQKDILVIHGQEVHTDKREDVIVIGTPPESAVPQGLPLPELIACADSLGGYKIIAAPFHDKGIGPRIEQYPQLAAMFDAIEEFSGEASVSFFGKFPKSNERAYDLSKILRAKLPELARTVGDDGHSINEIGRNYMEIQMPQNYMQFRDNPALVVNTLREAISNISDENNAFTTHPSKSGAYWHAASLVTLIYAQKLLGWDPNIRTAPFLERFGLII